MVDVNGLSRQWLMAVEARPALNIGQDRYHVTQIATLTTEQKLVQINSRSQDLLVLFHAPNESNPRPANKIADQTVKLSKAKCDSGFQLNCLAFADVIVQKSKLGVTDRLQFPERHSANNLVNLAHQ